MAPGSNGPQAQDPLARWQRLEEIFEQVLPKPREQRPALLEQLCAGDEGLRRDVEELLEADDRPDDFLDEPAKERRALAERALDGLDTKRTPTEKLGNAEATTTKTPPPPSPSPEALPERVGPYPVLGVLGRGGMGVVLLGKDPQLRRKVAIKTVPKALQQDRDTARRLAREARILASLDHPNIATLYGLVEEEGQRYLVLEYVDGKTLADRLAGGRLEVTQTLRLLSQVAAGLEAAHQRGVVHRDLKPANILITARDQVKIVDFGIAKDHRIDGYKSDGVASWEQSLTATGTVIGTASYLSPEQAEGRTVDSRTDIWAFGCVLWECLTGRRLFTYATLHRTIDAILHSHPPWDELPADVPVEVVKLLRRCLHKDQSQRLRDIGDARIELCELLTQAQSGELPAQLAQPVPNPAVPPPPRSPRRRTVALALLGGLLLAEVTFELGRWVVRRGHQSLEVAVPLESSLSTQPGSLAIAPDGRSIAYATTQGLYRRELTASTPVTLEMWFPHAPFFSPDGEWIGFMARNELLKMPAVGGAPTTVTTLGDLGVGASWGDDGHIVYAPGWSSPLWRIDANGGEAEPITELLEARGEVSHRFPHVLPGSHAVLYTVKDGAIASFDDAKIAVVDLRSGQQRPLLDRARQPGYFGGQLLFYREGGLFGVPFDLETLELRGPPVVLEEDVATDPLTGYVPWAVSNEGDLVYQPRRATPARNRRLSWVDARSEIMIEGLDMLDVIGGARISPDGRKLVIATFGANNSLWLHDLERGMLTRLVKGQGNANSPVWTPDSEWITFARNRGDVYEVVDVRVDGSDEIRPVWRGDRQHLPLFWSPDGQLLLTGHSLGASSQDVWLIPRDGEPRPALSSSANERDARFSPDGTSIVYAADETGRLEIYVRSFPDGRKSQQLSRRGGSQPLWSADGRSVYFVGAPPSGMGTTSILRVSLDEQGVAGEPERLFDHPLSSSLCGVLGERVLLLQSFSSLPAQYVHLGIGRLEHLE